MTHKNDDYSNSDYYEELDIYVLFMILSSALLGHYYLGHGDVDIALPRRSLSSL